MKSTIDFNTIKRGAFSLVLALFFTACGGGGSGGSSSEDPFTPTTEDTNSVPTVTPTTEDTNSVPTVSITTKSNSVTEGMSVEFNATATDSDNDTLTYSWTQKSGQTVTLINGTTAKPSFIAPDVSEDSNVSFEVEVSDGKVTTATKATVSVNVVDVPKATKRHEVMPISTGVSQSADSIKVTYTYNKTPITEITSGLVINVYWDSLKLTYKDVEMLLTQDVLAISAIKDDEENSDSDVSTDKYITISWVNMLGDWQVPSTLPASLFSIEMTKVSGAVGTTTLNIKNKVNSPGLEFYSQSVIISL